MAKLRYLTHPQVRIDASIPVPHWGLSEVGRKQVEDFKIASVLQDTSLIVSSGETKALETASIIADHLRIPIHVRVASHENDRSATGFLPPSEFEAVANQFFASPDLSIRGWERAIDAQRRICGVYEEAIAMVAAGDILMVGHGGVGTLLLCALSRQKIARAQDQPPGGGNLFCFDLSRNDVDHGWQGMELYAA